MGKLHKNGSRVSNERIKKISQAIDALEYLNIMMSEENDETSKLINATLTIIKITHNNIKILKKRDITKIS